MKTIVVAPMRLRRAIQVLVSITVLAGAQVALAQQTLRSDGYALTIEGYANITTSIADGLNVSRVGGGDDVRADLALRALGQIKLGSGPDLGIRLVAESSPENRLKLSEASLLLFGSRGRLEIG